MKADTASKAARLAILQRLLFVHPEGLTVRDIARFTGAHVRTVQRDIASLEQDLRVPLTRKGWRYHVLDTFELPPLMLTLHEAASLFVAARTLWRQCDKRNPYAVSAFQKLAAAFPSPVAELVLQTMRSLDAKPEDGELQRAFEALVTGWTAQRKVRLRYHVLGRAEADEHVFHPYLVESSGVAFGLYAMGYSEARQAIRTLKLERITGAEVTGERFERPEDLRLPEQIESAWGVMWEDDTTIRLRFTPAVTARVKESWWHPSQCIEDLSGGGCLFSVRVGGTTEIAPWIRGWGPDVEVLEPLDLRQRIAEEARRAAAVYGAATAGEETRE